MSDTSFSVAVVTESGGAHVDAYFAALRDTPECSEVVVFDESETCFAQAREILGEKLSAVFQSLDRMLQVANPDMAFVSMESVHAPPVIDQLLDAGCHVFTEKPACVRAEDLAPLVKKAETANLHLLFAFANRITPAAIRMKELVDGGLLGELYGAEIHFAADQTRLKSKSYHQSWFADRKRAGGGHLIWLGIHWLDLLTYTTGRTVTQVAGFSGIVGGQPLQVEDSAAMTMRFDNGSFGTMISGYYLDKGYHTHLRIWGSEGWIEYTEHLGDRTKMPLSWYSNAKAGDGIVNYDGEMEPKGYTPWVQACILTCEGKRPAPITGREALQVLRTIFTFYEATASGKTLTVPS